MIQARERIASLGSVDCLTTIGVASEVLAKLLINPRNSKAAAGTQTADLAIETADLATETADLARETADRTAAAGLCCWAIAVVSGGGPQPH